MSPFLLLRQMLDSRLSSSAHTWFKKSSLEIANGLGDKRFSMLLSLASRHAKDKQCLNPTEAENSQAAKAIGGWNLERWTLLEALRVALILGRTDLGDESGAISIEDAFTYADEGEQRALYRSLGLMPDAGRFVWRAGEGCRTNMLGVFEANVLDTGFPASFFDDVAFDQAAIKCVFVGAPLWRLWGLDGRLSEGLCHLALDLADERRSAGREVQGDLWLCLGEHLPQRSLEALMNELRPGNKNEYGMAMAIHGLLRLGQRERVVALAKEPLLLTEGPLKGFLDAALAGVSVYDFCRAYSSQ